MNAWVIIPLITCVSYIVLFIWALPSVNRRVNRLFCFYVAIAATWSFTSFMLHLNAFPQQALLWNELLSIALVWSLITYYHFIRAYVDKPAGKVLYLPDGLFFYVEYKRYLLTGKPDSLSPFPLIRGEHLLKIPGETVMPGWRIKAEILSPDQVKRGEDNYTAYFDLDKSGDAVSVRGRKTGDRFQPAGLNGSKKLGHFMIDEKTPASWRPHIPVVCAGHQIMWIVGWRIDDRVKVTQDTTRVLRLHFELDT